MWGGAEVVLQNVSITKGTSPTFNMPAFSLNNTNSTDEAKRLMEYLSSIYTKKTVSGQHMNIAWGTEPKYIKELTGKYPAIWGYDIMSTTKSTQTLYPTEHQIFEVTNNKGSLDSALNWGLEGGIVTLDWHWYAPLIGLSKDKSFYTQHTKFDCTKATEPGTPEYNETMDDMRTVAKALQAFKDNKIPVLFRPLHEAEGKWFWWGAKGPEAYIKLWKTMHDLYVYEYKLDNLIWVWNAPADGWYVGDDYCDICGSDLYWDNFDYGPMKIAYDDNKRITGGGKPVALTEHGVYPDPDLMFETEAYWLWFMAWNWGEDRKAHTVLNRVTIEQLRKVYHHDRVVTYDKLPKFR
jgi:mannan endo-1,4-beta-mannosidase